MGEIIKEFLVVLSIEFDEKKAKKAKEAIASLGVEAKGLALKVSAAAAALFGLAELSAAHSKELEVQSKMLGVTTGSLQELEFAMRVTSGVGRDELVGGLSAVSQTLFEARNNNADAAQAFTRLGISIGDVMDPTMSADKMLLILADRFKTMPDGMMKTALAAKVGGESFVRMLPGLSKGAEGLAKMGKEGRALGVVMDDATIKMGAEFSREVTRAWMVIQNIVFTVGAELVKYLKPALDMFFKFIVVNRKLIASGIAAFFKGLGLYISLLIKAVGWAVVAVANLLNKFNAFKKVAMALGLTLGVLFAPMISAILAVVLIIQDLFSDDSVIKEYVGKLGDYFTGLLDSVGKTFQSIYDWAENGLDGVFEKIGPAIDWVQAKVQGFIDLIEGAVSAVAKLDVFKGIGDKVASGLGSVSSFLGMDKDNPNPVPRWQGPRMAPAGTGGQAFHDNSQVTTNVTVMVPPGTSATAATGIVREGVAGALVDAHALRTAQNQKVGGYAH